MVFTLNGCAHRRSTIERPKYSGREASRRASEYQAAQKPYPAFSLDRLGENNSNDQEALTVHRIRMQSLLKEAEVLFNDALIEMQKGNWLEGIDKLSEAESRLEKVVPTPEVLKIVKHVRSDAYYVFSSFLFEYNRRENDGVVDLDEVLRYLYEAIEDNPKNTEARALKDEVILIQRRTL